MFERFMAFIDQLNGRTASSQERINPTQLAVTALMFAVMDADGVRNEAEVRILQDLVSERFDLEGGQLAQLISQGEEAEAQSVGFFQFTSLVIKLEEHERMQLVEMMWQVAFADGELHEMEDHVLWHIADLIGVSQRDRVELRRKAAAKS